MPHVTSSTPVPRTEYVSCSGPECEKPSQRQGLCFGHAQQKRRGERLSVLEKRNQTYRERLCAAAYVFVEAESDTEFIQALARLESAARAFARPKLCLLRACGRKSYMLGLCWKHFWARDQRPVNPAQVTIVYVYT